MFKQGCFVLGLIFLSTCLAACMGSLWTGASLVYDRHNVYKKLNDYHLALEVNKALYVDKKLKDCSIDVGVFNGDILLAGHLPSVELSDEVNDRLSKVHGYRHLFNQLRVQNLPAREVEDAWITTKIRSQIFADDSIDPKGFKVISADGIVYLMGDVRAEEAEKVVNIARHTSGVSHVVKIFNYFKYVKPA